MIRRPATFRVQDDGSIIGGYIFISQSRLAAKPATAYGKEEPNRPAPEQDIDVEPVCRLQNHVSKDHPGIVAPILHMV